LFLIFFSLFPKTIFAGVGTNNVTVITNLTVGNVYPEILNVSIEDNAASFTLTPNSTKLLRCVAVVRDYNGENDINFSNSTFFDNFSSSEGGANDNNIHYTNSSCNMTNDFGSYNGYSDDVYTKLVNCTYQVWYYANATAWNCTVMVNDSYDWRAKGYDLITISPLLALGLPDFIYYGTVNATYVSGENISNVTNYGNVPVNLSLSGYGFKENDGNAMNCTLGSNKNITIEKEKYNLTTSHSGDLTLSEFIANYTNLTINPVTKRFDLDFRHNDILNEAWNHTYWRIYVPVGVAGTCQGNIIFGAVQADGS
jgi:hypothetical protein